MSEIDRRFYAKHTEKRRGQLRDYNLRLRRAVFELLGGKCTKCEFDDWRALQIDHINGGGSKEKREIKGFYITRILKEIVAGSKKYQLLCANCNWIKRYSNNETVVIK